jgi:hypothetical protein
MNGEGRPRKPLPIESLARVPAFLDAFVDGLMLHLDEEYRQLCEMESK